MRSLLIKTIKSTLVTSLRRLGVLVLALYILKGLVMRRLRPDKPTIINKADDERIKRILVRMTVIEEEFMPTLWAQGSYMQFVALGIWKLYYASSVIFTQYFKRHVVTCEDGQTVALDEYLQGVNGGALLPETAPICLIIHTIIGQTAEEIEFAQLCFSRGWRPLFLSRRAHCGPLTVPKYNILGCANDTKQMVQRAVDLYPAASFVGAVGLSAGSGGIVNYIGQQNAEGLVHAAFMCSPGYDVKSTFDAADKASPVLTKILLKGLKYHFLSTHREVLSSIESYEHVAASSTLQEFVMRSAPMAGCGTFEEYLSLHNPMKNLAGNRIPCLILSAEDDPLCQKKLIPHDLFSITDHCMLACTRQGSHISWREGIFGQSCYMHRLALDFLEAAKLDVEELASQDK